MTKESNKSGSSRPESFDRSKATLQAIDEIREGLNQEQKEDLRLLLQNYRNESPTSGDGSS